jgi:ABC-type multidrug transport system fused ATPase/permease subunit
MFVKQDIALGRRRVISELAVIVITFIGRGVINAFIIVKGLSSAANLTIGQVMMYVQACSGCVNALAQIMQKLSSVYESSCFLRNYQQFAEFNHGKATRVLRAVPRKINSIEFKNVAFKYPGASEYSLKNINLKIEQGQSTLLVGRNGAGKTTLARLIVGLYEVSEGQIFVNGYDMSDYDLVELRKTMSIVFQDFVRYALTVEENIGIGSLEEMHDFKKVKEAATAARFEEVVRKLPGGYKTMLGKEFRDGHDLSYGQWQRLCLARLFMRDASVLIYDEPSASLDIETESALLQEIAVVARNKICVLVSHRMLRQDIADRIVVLDEGTILEEGTHEELVSSGGRYAHMWKLYHTLGSSDTDNVLVANE